MKIFSAVSAVAVIAIALALPLTACNEASTTEVTPAEEITVTSTEDSESTDEAEASEEVEAEEEEATPVIPPDTVVMVVNGEEITQGNIDELAQSMMMQKLSMMGPMGGPQGGMGDFAAMKKSAAEEARKEIVGITAFKQAVEKEGEGFADEAIAAKRKKIEEGIAKQGQTTLEEMMAQNGSTEEDLLNDIKGRLGSLALVARLVGDIEPSEEEVADYFEKNKDGMARLRTSHILLIFDASSSTEEGKAELKAKAEGILERVKAGEDFAKLAEEFSGCPSAQKGGDLGYYPRGAMATEYDAVAWELEIGGISDIVETSFGYHIIKAAERSEVSPEIVKDILIDQNFRTKLPEAVEILKEKAEIETPEIDLEALAASEESAPQTDADAPEAADADAPEATDAPEAAPEREEAPAPARRGR